MSFDSPYSFRSLKTASLGAPDFALAQKCTFHVPFVSPKRW
jgi:hypothetical protein